MGERVNVDMYRSYDKHSANGTVQKMGDSRARSISLHTAATDLSQDVTHLLV